MADPTSRRGKMYTCLHCEAQGKTYVEVRYRIIAHVYKHHLALDKAPFYCTLCLMRCTTKSALVNHVTKYSRHRLSLTQLGQVDSKRFLVENPRPAILVPGTDFRELTDEESSKLVPPKCPDTPLSSTGSLSCSSLPYQTNPVSSLQANDGGLINVQVTPEMLSQLLSSKSTSTTQSICQPSKENDFIAYSPAPSTNVPTYIPTPIASSTSFQTIQVPQLSTFPSCHAKTSTVTSATFQLLPSSQQQPPALTSTHIEPNLLPSPCQVAQYSSAVAPAEKSTLNTPVMGSTFNILNQLIDDTPSELDYEFDDDLVVGNTPQPSYANEAVQTDESLLEPQPKKMRFEEQTGNVQVGETIKELVQGSLAQLLDAFEKNSRAIRGIDKTLGTLTEAVVKMNRTMERMGEEQRRENERRIEERRERSYERRTDRSHDKKENRSLKSIVNKK